MSNEWNALSEDKKKPYVAKAEAYKSARYTAREHRQRAHDLGGEDNIAPFRIRYRRGEEKHIRGRRGASRLRHGYRNEEGQRRGILRRLP